MLEKPHSLALSIQPERGFPVKTGGSIPAYVYIVLLSVLLLGVWRILAAIWTFREARQQPAPEVWAPTLTVIAWALLVLGAIAALSTGHGLMGIVALVFAVVLPVRRGRRHRREPRTGRTRNCLRSKVPQAVRLIADL